jgi:dihydroneopterin aldolase
MTGTASSPRYDAIVVGAGPAGCSAALWLMQLGLRTLLVDRSDMPCAGLAGYHFRQDWVLGSPGQTLAEVGRHYADHVRSLAESHPKTLALALSSPVDAIDHGAAGWQVHLAGGATVTAACLVLATGLVPRRPPEYFDPALLGTAAPLFDAIGLTAMRDALPPRGRVLLLGGGDNAVENAHYLHSQGHSVTVACRHWRAQPALLARLQACTAIEQIVTPVLPRPSAEQAGAERSPGTPLTMQFADGTQRDFDTVAVLFGFEADRRVHDLALAALDRSGHPGPGVAPGAAALAEVPSAGLFVAGDASGLFHPCVHSALADGVRVAKAVQRWHSSGAVAANAAPTRLLRLDNLELLASIGWLDHEHAERQRIRVDTELKLQPQPLFDDDLVHVLDYRQVRDLIHDTCSAGHTRLLETLVERLAHRLSRLPGVLAVRLRITKLDIFDDCDVNIGTELGAW